MFRYERNSLIYTFVLSNDGTAQVTAGVLFPVIVDALNSQFGINLKEILISEEEFEQVKDTLGGAFETFDQYANSVIDNVVNFLGEIFGEDNATANVLNRIKNQINGYYEQYDDLAAAIGQTVKDINSYITDEVTEDWHYYDTRYFVDVDINVTDCLGNEIAGAEYTVSDSEGNPVELSEDKKSVNVPFGDYTIDVSVPEGYTLIEETNVSAITVNDKSGKYAFNFEYHSAVVTDKAEDPTCTSMGKTEGSHCDTCGTVIVAQNDIPMKEHDFSGEGKVTKEPTKADTGIMTYTCKTCGEATKDEVIPALGVIITVNTGELGTATINGEDTSNKETKMTYGEIYTLVAEPAEGSKVIGWMANGKMVTSDATYTTAAYADTTYTAVFAETSHNVFTITFMDNYGNVIAIMHNNEVAALNELPQAPQLAGYTFKGWSMTLEEIKALTESTVVTATYVSDASKTFTVTAEGCIITVNGTESENTALNVKYNSRVTVTPKDATATSWTANGAVAAYGDSYTFFCGSDVELTYSEGEVTAAPAIAAVKEEKTDTHVVSFLATRSVVDGYTLVESGFIYGKAMAEDDLTLDNVGTVQGTDGGKVKYVACRNIAADGQFALNYGVTAMDQDACARAYIIYEDNASGEASVKYSDEMIHVYG